MNNLLGKTVSVTMKGLVNDVKFEGKVMDTNQSGSLIWVECTTDSDWTMVNLNNPNINSIEEIIEEPISQTYQELKSIKKDLLKAIKYIDDEITIRVMVYDCDETGEQTYDVEINYYIDGQYENGFYTDTFYGDTEKEAVQRAKSVLRTVKGWFKNSDVTVEDGIEVYHA